MHSTITLPEPHQRTYEMVFEDPMSSALTWSALRALLGELGQVGEEPYGILRVTRKGQSLVLRTPVEGMESAPEQLARIREFIKRTRSVPPRVVRTGEWLVVIDRSEASVFRSVTKSAVPQLIRSPRPGGSEPRPGAMTCLNGPAESAPPGYFEPLAGVLHGARRILIMGRETTLGGEAERFIRWLRGYRPAVAERIVAWVSVEPHEYTEAGLVAKARDFYKRLEGSHGARQDDRASNGASAACA